MCPQDLGWSWAQTSVHPVFVGRGLTTGGVSCDTLAKWARQWNSPSVYQASAVYAGLSHMLQMAQSCIHSRCLTKTLLGGLTGILGAPVWGSLTASIQPQVVSRTPVREELGELQASALNKRKKTRSLPLLSVIIGLAFPMGQFSKNHDHVGLLLEMWYF